MKAILLAAGYGKRLGDITKKIPKCLIKVDNQPTDSLVTIMRSMFLQHSKNLETNIPQQIQELNKYVLDYAIQNVYSEAVAYLKYKHDASTMHVPMNAPIYSNKTNKTLEQKPWF